MQVLIQPTWNDDIGPLFAQPYWIAADRRAATGATWIGCMQGYGIDLSSYASVKQWSPLIYQYLHSGEMPLTANPDERWPDPALEMLRGWVNQGWRQTASDPVVPREIIPQPVPEPVRLRLRRDLRSLSQAELDDYRARVDDCLQVGDAAPDAPGRPCRLSLLVSALPSGRVLAADEYQALPGFTPRLDWSRSGWIARRTAPEPPASASCCHIHQGSEAQFLSVTDAKTSPTEGIVPCH
jgi:hypothetical protein